MTPTPTPEAEPGGFSSEHREPVLGPLAIQTLDHFGDEVEAMADILDDGRLVDLLFAVRNQLQATATFARWVLAHDGLPDAPVLP